VGAFERAEQVHPESRAAWRAWLDANHATASGVWLVGWRPATGRPAVGYEDAVEEALCFGWVDSRGEAVDAERTRLYFAPRKAGSGWAGTNKARVERLIAAGRMAPAGLAVVERAKADGTWTLLDAVERLEVPPDLATALAGRRDARANWDRFPPSARRVLLGWLVQARRPETRARRVDEIAAAAERNERAGPAARRD
jgi:uncharacterized protein YdeI (YjbR/CyaY-like superfamily)